VDVAWRHVHHLTLNPSKQIQYALLLNPAVALVIGHYLANASGRFLRFNQLLYGLLALAALAGAAFAFYKWRDQLEVAALLTLLIMAFLPAVLAAVLRIRALVYAPLLLASVVGAAVFYNQTRLYDEGSDRFEVEAKLFALASREYAPLYAYGLNNYGFAPVMSFYSQRVIPVLADDEQLAAKAAATSQPFYVAAEKTPQWPAQKKAEKILSEGDFTLWLVR
jgi:hypothetical protein